MSECWTRSADRAHYGLAIHCAKRFFGRGVPREDLIAEAEAALLYAATRFDESRGTRFSTYAVPFVLGALRALCEKEMRNTAELMADMGDVPAPEAGFEERVLLKQELAALGAPFSRVLWLRYGHGLTQAETARCVGLSQSQCSRVEKQACELLRLRRTREALG